MIKNAIEYNKPFGIILSEGDGVYSKGVKVAVTKVFKEYKNGEYDILVKGQDIFNVISTEMDGDTFVGEIEYVPIDTDIKESHFHKFQDSYLKLLMKKVTLTLYVTVLQVILQYQIQNGYLILS